jgi:hypothetical protein
MSLFVAIVTFTDVACLCYRSCLLSLMSTFISMSFAVADVGYIHIIADVSSYRLLTLMLAPIAADVRRNCTELRPASRAPSTPGLPPRWLYQAPGAMGGRAEYAGVHGGHQERP